MSCDVLLTLGLWYRNIYKNKTKAQQWKYAAADFATRTAPPHGKIEPRTVSHDNARGFLLEHHRPRFVHSEMLRSPQEIWPPT